MKQWFKKMETWMGGGEGGARRSQTFRWLIILGLIRGGNHAVQFLRECQKN
ncbi:hypothetical protein QF041_000028 [Paenibacillus sp. W2I17]|nr:hypothetical protein [Paenibacillus sp. W2I17]